MDKISAELEFWDLLIKTQSSNVLFLKFHPIRLSSADSLGVNANSVAFIFPYHSDTFLGPLYFLL